MEKNLKTTIGLAIAYIVILWFLWSPAFGLIRGKLAFLAGFAEAQIFALIPWLIFFILAIMAIINIVVKLIVQEKQIELPYKDKIFFGFSIACIGLTILFWLLTLNRVEVMYSIASYIDKALLMSWINISFCVVVSVDVLILVYLIIDFQKNK